jgi:hypothetical protein
VKHEQGFDHHGREKPMFDRAAWRRECYERYLLGAEEDELDDAEEAAPLEAGPA